MTDPRPTMDTASTPATPAADSTALQLEGTDVLPLLHRISTQKLDDLSPGGARITLFCDFRGRLLHRAAVALTSDHKVWLLREDAGAGPLAAFVDRHVFREDVRITDRSSEFAVVARPDHEEQPPGLRELEGGVHTVAPGDGVVLLMVPRHTGGFPVDRAAEERFRIGIGRAAHGHEIVEDFSPFEVGLGAAVHLDKGCFTGQETLMRLVTYDSVRREMARVEGAGPAPPVPAQVTSEGQNAGVLTSAIEDASPGRWIGLAVVKRDFATGGLSLVAGGRPIEGIHRLTMPRALGRP